MRSGGVNVPTLFLSGKCDDVVPEKDMNDIYKAAISTMPVYRGNRVSFKSFELGGHDNMYLQEGYFETIREWLIKNFGNFPEGPLAAARNDNNDDNNDGSNDYDYDYDN